MTDLRFGLRMLVRNPGSTALIVALLGLGIGASAVIFTLFDAVLLRRLPVRHPEELVGMVQHLPKIGTRTDFPYPYYQALHDHATTLAASFGETGRYLHFRLTNPDPAEAISVYAVTPEFFDALAVRALYGRVLMADDAKQQFGLPPAVLSYGFWRRRFHSDPRVVKGRTLDVNGHRFLIVGVMPRDFNGISADIAPDIRVPFRAYSLLVNISMASMNFELAGRLKPGTARSRAEAECLAIWQSTMKEYYQSRREPPHTISVLLRRGMQLEPLERGVSILRDRFGTVLKLLMASVSLLVLIVCINVAGLMLARAAGRQQEIAVRLAIGATRFQVAGQIVVEGFLLAALGAGCGLLIAIPAIPLALRMLPPVRDVSTSLVPLSIDVGINWRVFLFVLALSAITLLFFSAAPAIAASRSSLNSVLRAVRSMGGTRGRQILISRQIALCTFMLIGASLLVRTFQQVQGINPGFDYDHLATFTADLSGHKDPEILIKLLTERVREIPGVISAAISSVGVMRQHGTSATVAPAGERIAPADFMNVNMNRVSTEYFGTMGIHILAGRDFSSSDTPGSKRSGPMKVIVNEAFVRRFFSNADPMGKRFGFGMVGAVAGGNYEIVGVVSDAKYRSLREPISPMFYTPEIDPESFVLNVRTRARPQTIIGPVREALRSIDRTLPFLEVHTLAEEVEESTAQERTTAALASLFGAIATVLAGMGIYGLLA